MARPKMLALCLILVSSLAGTNIGPWQNIRCSGKTAANEVFVRLENTVDPATENKLLHYNGTSIVQQSFSSLNSQTGTMQSVYTPVGSNADLGLISNGTAKNITPVYYSGTANFPAPAQFTEVSADTLNEQSTNYMDIVKDFFSFSGTKFHAAIQNRGGGFPLGGTLGMPPYYSYMVVIANLADTGTPPDEATIWAMNYMNVTFGGISPGLYRIQGTGQNALNRIGDISTEIVSGSNLLKLSCNISDLLADPAFTAWYNTADPVFGMVSMTQKTTLSGLTPVVELMDVSPGANIHPKRLNNPLHPETLPVLSSFSFNVAPNDIWFQTTYQDPYGRFPLSISASWQNGQTFNLYPQSLDHSDAVIYRTADLTGDLDEYDDRQTSAKASVDNSSYAYSNSPSHSYILNLQPPQNLYFSQSGGNWQLNWDASVRSLTDELVYPDSFTVEYSTDPNINTFSTLGTYTGSSASLDSSPARRFFRVKAFEQVP